ncbi:hypothetical protein O9992_12985 [Vibrio lentus]|nr:hypothetical protein [Vibrio lentus]
MFDDKYADNLKQLIELGIQFRVDLNAKFTENKNSPHHHWPMMYQQPRYRNNRQLPQ